jgi:hypothetical protein
MRIRQGQVPNGIIDEVSGMGLAFSRTGELFATRGRYIDRYLFDKSTGMAVPNGSIYVSDWDGLHGIAFSPRGELFAAEVYENKIYRLQFDKAGALILSGSFGQEGGPVGLAFAPNGELFVSYHFNGGISRFGFDVDGNPISKEFIPTELGLGFLAVYPSVR